MASVRILAVPTSNGMHLYAWSPPAYRVAMVTGLHWHDPDHGRNRVFADTIIETNGIVYNIPARAFAACLSYGAADGGSGNKVFHQACAGR